MNYTETTIVTNTPWRATPRATDSKRAGRISKSNVSPAGNGATNYGKLKAGTILARDSNGLLHPLGCAKVAVAPSASNDVEVDNAAGFYVGDLVSIRSGSNKTKSITNNSVVLSIVAKVQGLNFVIAVAGHETPLSSTYDPVTKTITVNAATRAAATVITAGASSSTLTVIPRYTGLSLDIVIAGTDTPLSHAFDESDQRITINGATNGGGTSTTTLEAIVGILKSTYGAYIVDADASDGSQVLVDVGPTALNGAVAGTSTHAQVVGELLKYGQLIESASSATPATAAVALASTALESAKFGVIASARTVSAITGTTLTLSGAVFTAAIDDVVVKDGAYKPVGILDETLSTTSYIDDTVVAQDRTASVAYEGDARNSSSYVHNLSAGVAGTFVKRCLGGHVCIDPGVDPSVSAPTEVVPSEFVGFRFLDV